MLECLPLNTENEIDGSAFMDLTEADIKQLIKPLGAVKKILRLQKSLSIPHSPVSKLKFFYFIFQKIIIFI